MKSFFMIQIKLKGGMKFALNWVKIKVFGYEV